MSTENNTHPEPARFIACVVTYHGPTDTRGSRVKMFFPRFQKGKMIPFDHAFNNSADIARDYFRQHGIHAAGECELGTPSALLFTWDNFGKLESLFGF